MTLPAKSRDNWKRDYAELPILFAHLFLAGPQRRGQPHKRKKSEWVSKRVTPLVGVTDDMSFNVCNVMTQPLNLFKRYDWYILQSQSGCRHYYEEKMELRHWL